MASPKALLFDLGNVLFEIDIPGCSQRIYDLLDEDIDRKAFRDAFKEKNEGLETGAISKGVFVNFILSHARKDVQALDVIEAWNSMLMGMPERHFELLTQLRKKYKVFLLSNINPIHINRFKEIIVEDHGIRDFDDYFDRCFYSSEIGYRKPDPDCFRFVLDQISLSPGEVFFMDDTLPNVQVAQELGIPSSHITEFQQTKSLLEKLL